MSLFVDSASKLAIYPRSVNGMSFPVSCLSVSYTNALGTVLASNPAGAQFIPSNSTNNLDYLSGSDIVGLAPSTGKICSIATEGTYAVSYWLTYNTYVGAATNNATDLGSVETYFGIPVNNVIPAVYYQAMTSLVHTPVGFKTVDYSGGVEAKVTVGATEVFNLNAGDYIGLLAASQASGGAVPYDNLNFTVTITRLS